MKLTIKKRFSGQSLIGLLVAIAISSTFLLILSQFFAQQLISRHARLQDLFLQQEVIQALQMMVKDLRRTGFVAVKKHLITRNLPYFVQDPTGRSWNIGEKTGEKEKSCILFFYDLDHSGCIGGKNNKGDQDDKETYCWRDGKNQISYVEEELFGYRLNQGALEMRYEIKKNIDSKCHASQCKSYTEPQQCNSTGWRRMTAENIQITQLTFSPVANGKGLKISLSAQLSHQPQHQYQTQAWVVFMNQEGQ